MSTLRYAILGLLSRKSMTGYELSKEFETNLFEFWNTKHSQIYPELKNLTQSGLVEYTIQISGNVMEKKVYSLTQEGKDAFFQWAQTESDTITVPKDEFRLRLYFSDEIPTERRLALLRRRLAQHQQRLEHFHQNLKKFPHLPPEDEQDFSDYLVLTGGIFREESTCRWLEQCIELCEKRKKK
jgi:DNA-binding PadR family transcriptional regulator